jgi:enoyl-CoA hydratase/carnithine racemase
MEFMHESTWDGLFPRPQFAEYQEKYADFFVMRREGGILELRSHAEGGSYFQTAASHNAWGQVFREVGNDPENEVLILTGTGDKWFDGLRSGGALAERTPAEIARTYEDAQKLVENFVFGVDIPTIAAINGPGLHTELALACDLTLCTEDTQFFDPHFLLSTPPGDGQGLAFQELLGTKRATYHLYTSEPIDARRAVETGLVSEVLTRDRLLSRAWELAELIMRRPRNTRRMTHAIASRAWKQRVVNDFGFQLYHQAFAVFADEELAGVPPAHETLTDYPF